MSNLRIFRNCKWISGLALYAQEPSEALKSHPVLFVHGMWGGSWVWQHYVQHFNALGYRCYVMDLRGHGESKPVDQVGEVSIEQYLEDVRQVAQTLERPILIGHSMGGLLVLKVSELQELAASVLVCPTQPAGNFGPPGRSQLAFMARHMIELVRGQPIKPSKPEAVRNALNRVAEEDIDWVFGRSSPGSGRALREMILGKIAVDPADVRCSVLAVAASEDRTIPARVVEKLASKYEADYREYPDAGHMLPIEPMWERSAAFISNWLEKLAFAA